MSGVIRSELLRAVSGLSILAVYLVAVLMPTFVLVSDGSRFALDGLDPGAATARLLEPLAWSVISAAFVGAYPVTREYYYGVLIALALAGVVFLLWTLAIPLLLARHGLALVFTAEAWRIIAGAVAGVVLGALIGGAIGWITRNYYATAIIVLVFPMALEFALLRTAPEIARFSPGMAIAALSVPEYQGRLLAFVPALGIGVAWAIGLVALAAVRGRRSVA